MQIQEPSLTTPASATPSPPVTAGQMWRDTLHTWWKATLAVLPAFLITRCIFLLLTYFGGVLFSIPNYSPYSLSFRDLLYTWAHWDVNHFTGIALHGYASLDYVNYYPLFPVLERTVYTLLHRDIMEVGMLISNLAFLGALIVFYRLVESEFDGETARRAVLYISIFPTALFFFAPYSEALLLLLVLLCFYCMRRGSWWLAGLFGFLALLTRFVAIFLFVIFLCEYARQALPQLREARRAGHRRQQLRLLFGLVASLLIPAGLGLYTYAFGSHFHDPLAFWHAQFKGFGAPWIALVNAVKSLLTYPAYTFATPHVIIDLTAFVLFLVLLILSLVGPERFAAHQWTFTLFGLLLLFYALCFPGTPGPDSIPYDPMPSMQRYVLVIFAGFIVLARSGRRPWFHQAYLLLSLPLLAFLVLQFLTGHWTV